MNQTPEQSRQATPGRIHRYAEARIQLTHIETLLELVQAEARQTPRLVGDAELHLLRRTLCEAQKIAMQLRQEAENHS